MIRENLVAERIAIETPGKILRMQSGMVMIAYDGPNKFKGV